MRVLQPVQRQSSHEWKKVTFSSRPVRPTTSKAGLLLLVALAVFGNVWPVMQHTDVNPPLSMTLLPPPRPTPSPTPSPTPRVCLPYDSDAACDSAYADTLGDWAYTNRTVLSAIAKQRQGNGGVGKTPVNQAEAHRELVTLLGQDAALQRRTTFEGIYKDSVWNDGQGGGAVGSGTGSTLLATVHARKAILDVIDQHNVSSILDASCGDLSWMRDVFPELDRRGVHYVGVDTVRPLIDRLSKEFEADKTKTFMVRDLVADPMPQGADLIVSRQVREQQRGGGGCARIVEGNASPASPSLPSLPSTPPLLSLPSLPSTPHLPPSPPSPQPCPFSLPSLPSTPP